MQGSARFQGSGYAQMSSPGIPAFSKRPCYTLWRHSVCECVVWDGWSACWRDADWVLMQYSFRSIVLFQADVTRWGSTAFLWKHNTLFTTMDHPTSSKTLFQLQEIAILNEGFKDSGCKMSCTLNNSQHNWDKWIISRHLWEAQNLTNDDVAV